MAEVDKHRTTPFFCQTRRTPAVVALAAAMLWCGGVAAQDGAAGGDSDVAGSDSGGSSALSRTIGVHPGLRLEGGFDSNIFFEDEQENPLSAPSLSVVPFVEIDTRKSRSVALKLKAEAEYLQYLSDDQRVQDQSGFFLRAQGSATFNPRGAVALRISDSFQRTNEAPSGAAFDSFNRIYNDLGAAIVIQPGGKILVVELGGHFAINRNSFVPDLDNQTIGMRLGASWRFLPKTKFVLNASWDFVTYDQRVRSIPFYDEGEAPDFVEPFENDDTALRNINSQPLRIETGIDGLVGRRLSIKALIGYSKAFYDSGDDFSSITGLFQGGYEIGPTSRFALGYERNYQDTSFGNFMSFHKVFGRYNHQFGGKFDLMLEGNFQLQQYRGFPQITLPSVSVDGQPGAGAFSDTERDDPVFGARAEGTYYFGSVFMVGARYMLDVNASDFVLVTGIRSPEGVNVDNDINQGGTATVQFVKHRAFIFTGVRW